MNVCILNAMKILNCFLWMIVFFSCKKYNQMSGSAQGATVYLSSYTPIGHYSAVYGDPFMATYFKNSQRLILEYDSTLNYKTSGIYVSGSDIYVCGTKNYPSVSVARYWKNGASFPLSDSLYSSAANAIAVAGGDVYIAGSQSNGIVGIARYWKNDFPVNLTDGTKDASASAITIVGQDIYVAGTEWVANPNIYQAKYWKNGVAVVLPSALPSWATGIAVSGTDVYVSGYIFNGANNIATYWKNGVAVALTDGSSNTPATAIAIRDSDVYITGFTRTGPLSYYAEYWKNGQLTHLTNGNTLAYATSIVISGSDIYIGGSEAAANGRGVIKYWKNNNPVLLGDSINTSFASGIFVTQP
jgi:hypothetical protein